MNEKDVVIVGGGIAGLTAAAYLARAGLSVQVFEQHSQPGGYVSSFSRQGFIFPAGPTSFGSNGIIFPILNELGLDDRLQFCRACHQISWGAHDVPLRTPQETRRMLTSEFPNEGASLKRYFRWVKTGGNAFHDSLKGGMMFGHGVFKSILLQLLTHPLSLSAFWLAARHTNRSLHRSLFRDDLLRQMLDQLGYPVMAGKNTLGMWASYYYDTWMPIRGMQGLVDVLVADIREHGGKVHLGTAVRRIRIENGIASGVELQSGAFISAGWIVSAADLHQTCFQMIGREQLPETMISKLEKSRPSESLFAVFLGLHDTPELSASLKRFHESHVHYTCKDGNYIQLVLLSKDDSTVAPPGKHALFVAMLSPYEDWEPLKSYSEEYAARKAACAEELISRAEEFLPGLRASVVVREAATPLTYENFTSNWRGGTSGWNWDPKDAPRFELEKDLPIKRFFSVGHYVHNPGGVPTAMITAWYIARSIIREARMI